LKNALAFSIDSLKPKKRPIMTIQTFTAVIHKETDLYVAECPEVGTASQGPTIEEAISNLKEATELYLEEFPKPMINRTIMTTFEAKYA
jgi:predicted RNase H-like HicB family nuclease